MPYVCTELETRSARARMLIDGADPALAYLGPRAVGGSCSPCRRRAPARGRAVRPAPTWSRRSRGCAPSGRGSRQVVVKLDAGVSGEGNAIVELRGLPRPGARAELRADRRARRRDAPAGRRASRSATTSSGSSAAAGSSRSGSSGASCAARACSSSSAPGEARIVSTHDQILAATCASAAASRPSPRTPRDHRGGAAGRRAAGRGGCLRARRDRLHRRPQPLRHWSAYAIEINLRKGDDAPPHDARAAQRRRVRPGRRLPCPGRRAAPLRRHRPPRVPAPDRARQQRAARARRAPGPRRDGCGVVFHMLSSLGELGRMGMTAIGHSAADAQLRYDTDSACCWPRRSNWTPRSLSHDLAQVSPQQDVPASRRTFDLEAAMRSCLLALAFIALLPATARADCADADTIPTAQPERHPRRAAVPAQRGTEKRDLPRLRENARLRRAATEHSAEMIDGATSPDGARRRDSRPLGSGYAGDSRWVFGENLAWGPGNWPRRRRDGGVAGLLRAAPHDPRA